MAASATDKAKKTYSFLQKTLNGGISDVATSLIPNNVTNIPTDTAVSFIIDRVDSNGTRTPTLRELMTGYISGGSIIGLVRGEQGTTAQAHANGAVIEFVNSGEMWNDLIDFVLQDHSNPGGNHKSLTDDNGNEWAERGSVASAVNQVKITNAATGNGPKVEAAGDNTNIDLQLGAKGTGKVKAISPVNFNSQKVRGWDGWQDTDAALSVVTGYNKGNKEYDITSDTDLSTVIGVGMRLKLTRGTAPPTQCSDLESSSSQYASKTTPAGLTFTDDWTAEGWVKLESYVAGGVVARRNADTEGWSFGVNAAGQVEVASLRIAANNRIVNSNAILPLNTWVHIAASMDNSGAATVIYINGVAVPTTSTVTGTITALVQGTTALVVGALKSAGTSPFDGKLAEVRVWNTVRTATEIRDNMNQQLSSIPAACVVYFKLAGDFVDASANANTATAQGSATATNVDNPMNSTEYGIVTKITSTIITVFCGTDYNIPNMTLSTPYFSTQKAPFGFNPARSKWAITVMPQDETKTSPSGATWVNVLGGKIQLPIGEWLLSYDIGRAKGTITSTAAQTLSATLSTAGTTEADARWTTSNGARDAGGTSEQRWDSPLNRAKLVAVTADTDYYLNVNPSGAFDSIVLVNMEIVAECAYL